MVIVIKKQNVRIVKIIFAILVIFVLVIIVRGKMKSK